MKTAQFLPTYKCLILDKDKSFAYQLVDYIQEIPNLEVLDIYLNAEQALNTASLREIDFLFLEIDKANAYAFDLTIKLRNLVKFIVFISNKPEYALDAFQAGADQFLLKPILFPKFALVISNLLAKDKERQSLNITQICDGEWLRIPKLNELT